MANQDAGEYFGQSCGFAEICTSSYLLSCIGVTLPKEVYLQNYRLGFLLLFLRITVLVICIYFIFDDDYKSWLRSEMPVERINAWVESGAYDEQSRADFKQDFCDRARNQKYHYWFDDVWEYVNMSCRSLPFGERYEKTREGIYIPTFFSETFVETRASDKIHGAGSCADDCKSVGSCPSSVVGVEASATQHFASTDAVNVFGECLCECKRSHNFFATGVIGLQIALSTVAKIQDGNEKLSTTKFGSQFLIVLRDVRHATPVEIKRFQPGTIPKMTLAEWLRIGGVESLDEVNTNTYSNRNKDPKYLQQPLLRLTGFEVHLAVNYHNRLDPSHITDDWNGPICYIDVTVEQVWSTRPVMDWGAMEDVRGNGNYRYRYQSGILIVYDTQGRFSYWNPLGIFTMLASILVYLSLPTRIMMVLTRYCLGLISNIYYKAQFEILELREYSYGMLCRSLIGKACYEMFLDRQRQDGDDGEVLTSHTLHCHLKELFEEDIGMNTRDSHTLASVLANEGIYSDSLDLVPRKAFVEACGHGEASTLIELTNLFESNCWTRLIDSSLGKERSRLQEQRTSWRNISTMKAVRMVSSTMINNAAFLFGSATTDRHSEVPKMNGASDVRHDGDRGVCDQALTAIPTTESKALALKDAPDREPSKECTHANLATFGCAEPVGRCLTAYLC